MTRSNDDDRNILLDIGDDPVAAAEALVEEFGSARKQLYHSIAKALAIAEVLEANDQQWKAFNVHVTRKGLHVCKQPLRGVMCFLFKARQSSGSAYDRACCYTRAVEQLRRDEAASAANIADLIRQRGGLEELYAEAKAARTAKEEDNNTDQDNPRIDEGEHTVEPPGGEADENAHSRATAVTNNSGLSNGKKSQPKKAEIESPREPRKFTKEWCERRLIMEISPAKLQEVLEMRNRQRGSLDFAAGGKDEVGFKIYTVDNLQLE